MNPFNKPNQSLEEPAERRNRKEGGEITVLGMKKKSRGRDGDDDGGGPMQSRTRRIERQFTLDFNLFRAGVKRYKMARP